MTIRRHFFSCIPAAAGAFLLAVSLVEGQTAAQSTLTLAGSIRQVEAWTQVGPPDPRKPLMTRKTLKQAERDASMTFEIPLKLRNLAELQARIAKGEQIPLKEMAAKYHPQAADEQAVADWLTSEGFTIMRRDPTRLAVFARGKVSQVEKAFQVTFGRVSVGGREYTSAITEPSVPANLAPLLVGVNGLQPHIKGHKHSVLRPNTLSSTSPPFTPSQIEQAYSASGLYTNGITGAGQTIAIAIDTLPLKSDLTTFWSTYSIGQNINNITFVPVVTSTLPATEGEETLDVEWSSAMAPGAKIRVYASGDLDTASMDQVYEQIYYDTTYQPQLNIHQMSMSYGFIESLETTSSQAQTDDQYFAVLASAGVTVFASAGDAGSTPNTGSNIDESGRSLLVESPASDPYVTGVGGTSLTLNASTGNESSETVWNDYSTSNGATGGGASIYFSRPSWQTGTGVPTGTARLVPDVASDADPNTGVYVTYTDPSTGTQSQLSYGGTSVSSPTWAGFCALINQARANAGLSSVGLLGPKIYPLLSPTATYNANFRDITSGNNATNRSGGKYTAGTGYDETTGLGVPLVQTLSQTLSGTSTSQTVVQVSPAFQDIVPGNNATISVTSTGSPTSYQWQRMPVGTTTWSNLSNNGTYSGSATASLTINGATTAMSGDQFQCITTYSGSSNVTSPSSSLVVDTPFTIINIAGSAGVIGTSTSNGTGSGAQFAYPSGIAIDSSGNLYIADYNNNCIRKVTPGGVVTTPASDTGFSLPNAVVADKSNNLYVANTGSSTNNTIQEISAASGTVTTIASGFSVPNGMAIDGSGNLYVADAGNNDIVKLTNNGNGTFTSSTLAGNSTTAGYANGTGTAAEFNYPTNLALDSSGNIYVADYNNAVIRKITPAGVVTLFAGQPGVIGYADGLSAKALFNRPSSVAVDASGNVYVTDSLIPSEGAIYSGTNVLRRISTAGVVSTIAGDPQVVGSASGTGTAAQFYSLQFATFNSAGEMFLVDTYNQLVRAGGIIPAITTQPVGQVATVGQAASFSVAATGTANLTYQWLENGTAIPGATASTYTIPSVASTSGGDYSVTVSNAFGSVTTTAATLIPFNAEPVAQTVTAGQNATFSVSPAGTGPFSYQWLFNGGAISGATAASYTIDNVSTGNGGSYSVVVSDSYGTVTTGAATLTVNSLPTDTPTLPPWAVVLLGGVLFFAAKSRLRRVSERG